MIILKMNIILTIDDIDKFEYVENEKEPISGLAIDLYQSKENNEIIKINIIPGPTDEITRGRIDCFNDIKNYILTKNFVNIELDKIKHIAELGIFLNMHIMLTDLANYFYKHCDKNNMDNFKGLPFDFMFLYLQGKYEIDDLQKIVNGNLIYNYNPFIDTETCCKSVYENIYDNKIFLNKYVTHLTFGYYYNQPTTLPNSITHLTFEFEYNQPTTLPNSVTHVTFGHRYNQPTALPNSVTHLTFMSNSRQLITFPNSIIRLRFGTCYNRPTTLPNNIRRLTFGYWYNQPTTLPNGITHLTFGYHYNQPTTFPNSITHLTVGEYYNQPTTLPKNIVKHNLHRMLLI
jgi:hypothetical protein